MERFRLGDIVDVVGRKLIRYGTVIELRASEKKVLVCFETPRRPTACDKCGIPNMLSVNASSGEVVCMRSGCGHEHGFEKLSEILDVNQLVNITNQRLNKTKTKFRGDLEALVRGAAANKTLTAKQQEKILGGLKAR